ncbi:hypothetical protein [Arthrobacter pigmenti]
MAPASSKVTVTAVVLAAASILALVVILAINLAGGTAWPVLTWIPMLGLPIAFIIMAALVVAAIRRRLG